MPTFLIPSPMQETLGDTGGRVGDARPWLKEGLSRSFLSASGEGAPPGSPLGTPPVLVPAQTRHEDCTCSSHQPAGTIPTSLLPRA